MRFLPIVDRELREASRRAGTYWLRTIVATIIVIISTCLFLFNMEESPRDVAQLIFHTLGAGALLYCLFAGLHGTADSISEEKREGTLGLLFLTDLKGYDVVLGKLVASSLNSFYSVLAILPVLGIPLLMGSVTGIQLAHAAVALINAIFFSLCAGIFASAICRSHQRAVGLAILIILGSTAGAPLFGAWLDWNGVHRLWWEWFALPSPVYSYILGQISLAGLGQSSPEMFYTSLAIIHGMAWFLLALACVIAPRSWQDRPAGVARLKWLARIKNTSTGGPGARRQFRTRLLDRNAFFWLAARDRLKPTYVWIFLAVGAVLWLWGAVKFRNDWMDEAIFISTAFLLNSILKNWLANETVRQLSDDRKMGSLELLLSTPLSVSEILRGQALALWRQFFWPVVLVLTLEVLMLIVASREAYSIRGQTFRVCLWLAGMIMLVADIITLYWVGMWRGLAAKNPKRAFSGTVARVLALPWILYIGGMTFVGLLMIGSRSSPDIGPGFLLGCWFVVGLAVDFGFGLQAWNNLNTRFREVATQRFQAQPSFLKRVFGSGNSPPPSQ